MEKIIVDKYTKMAQGGQNPNAQLLLNKLIKHHSKSTATKAFSSSLGAGTL